MTHTGLLESPRWSGNASLTVRAKYDYAPQNPDELAFRYATSVMRNCYFTPLSGCSYPRPCRLRQGTVSRHNKALPLLGVFVLCLWMRKACPCKPHVEHTCFLDRHRAGDVIDVRGQSDDHWYWGHLASRKGLVPANFVEVSFSSGTNDMVIFFACLARM